MVNRREGWKKERVGLYHHRATQQKGNKYKFYPRKNVTLGKSKRERKIRNELFWACVYGITCTLYATMRSSLICMYMLFNTREMFFGLQIQFVCLQTCHFWPCYFVVVNLFHYWIPRLLDVRIMYLTLIRDFLILILYRSVPASHSAERCGAESLGVGPRAEQVRSGTRSSHELFPGLGGRGDNGPVEVFARENGAVAH
jgi:hypothetical protein